MDTTPAMRIRKLHVESFGSVKDATVELSPLTVLVGPNDSGKSTLLRVLATLADASKLPAGWRSVFPTPESLVSQTFDGRGDSIRFGIAGELAAKGFDYQAEVSAALGYSFVKTERVQLGDSSVDRAEMKLKFHAAAGAEMQKDAPDGVHPLLHRDYLVGGALRSDVQVAGELSQLLPLLSAVKAISTYSLRPESLRRPTGPGTWLFMDGTGLSAALANLLLNHRDVAQRVEEGLCVAMPHVKRLHLSQQAGAGGQVQYEIELLTRSGARIPGPNISDGVLLYLGYLYLVLGPDPASVLLVEEPETGIHFGILKSVMKLFRDMTTGAHGGSPTQVILTTHSPMLLNLVEPEEIRIVQRGADGATHVSRFSDAPGLAKLLDYQGPGEIWVNEGEEYLTRRGTPRS